jgi:hypothetical protein
VFKILKILVFFLTIAFLLGCHSSTKPQKGTISGTLTLAGLSDYSGITVMVFQGDVVGDDIKDVCSQYPQLAFPVSDEHVFDHRNYKPVSTYITSDTGAFSIADLEYAKYILVFFKEGWGYNYLFEIELNTESYSVITHFDSRDLILHPVTIVSTQITGEYIFESYHTYVVEQDVICIEGSTLVFQPLSKVLLAPGKKITIYGTAICPTGDSYSYITSVSGMYGKDVSKIINGYGVMVFNNSGTIGNLCMSFMDSALTVRGSNTNIQNVLIRNSNFGITSYQIDNINIVRCVFVSNQSTNGSAVYSNLVEGFHADSCIFSQNYISINNEVTTSAIIENCSFWGGNREFLNLWESAATFEHNRIENQSIAVENSGRSNLNLAYNDIHAKICVKTYHTNNWYNDINNGWTKAANNNFSATEKVVQSEACYYYSGLAYPLDFKQNYWGTTNSQTISELIVDYHDLGDHESWWVWSEVLFQPFRLTKVQGTGIQ